MSEFIDTLQQRIKQHEKDEIDREQKKLDNLRKSILNKLGNPEKIKAKMLKRASEGKTGVRLMYLPFYPWFSQRWTESLIRQVGVRKIIENELSKSFGTGIDISMVGRDESFRSVYGYRDWETVGYDVWLYLNRPEPVAPKRRKRTVRKGLDRVDDDVESLMNGGPVDVTIRTMPKSVVGSHHHKKGKHHGGVRRERRLNTEMDS